MSAKGTLPKNRLDLIGQRFGRLLVLAEGPRGHQPNGLIYRTWKCACDCGQIIAPRTGQLRSGNSKSCGCLTRDTTRARNLKHGCAATRTAEYRTWKGINSRCNATKGPDFPFYAGRGIAVCERWKSFEYFLADMGPRPSARHSIDRIDVNQGYSPENCRWASPIEQANNKRTNLRLTFNGAEMTVMEAIRASGTAVAYTTIVARIRSGWDAAQAITTPLYRRAA